MDERDNVVIKSKTLKLPFWGGLREQLSSASNPWLLNYLKVSKYTSPVLPEVSIDLGSPSVCPSWSTSNQAS